MNNCAFNCDYIFNNTTVDKIVTSNRRSAFSVVTHTRKQAGLSDRCWCPYICMFVEEKNLNRTSAIDSPFQTFAVGLLVEFIDKPLLSPKTLSSSSKLRIFLFNAHLDLELIDFNLHAC